MSAVGWLDYARPMSGDHPFQTAGLGIAPFKFIRREKILGSRCAYCGKAINRVYFCEGMGGLPFGVGSDCIKKVERPGFIENMERQIREQDKAALPGRIEQARAILEANPKFLSAPQHPKRRGTLRSYVEYLLEHGATTGLTKACDIVERERSKKK